MKIRYDVVSDVGCVRSNNEDMALVFGSMIRDTSESSMVNVTPQVRFSAIVADGMGGYEGGEVASEFTLHSFDEMIERLPASLDETDLRIALNQWLEQHQLAMLVRQRETGLSQMGTTLTGIVTYEDIQLLINAGDSRVYRYRYGNLRQLSEDHSERNRLNDPSIPSNLIYNAIGIPDAFLAITNMTETFPICDGDVYLICSDGLNDMIEDDVIQQILDKKGTAQDLVNAAKAAGGRDNCTVILLYVSIDTESAQHTDSKDDDSNNSDNNSSDCKDDEISEANENVDTNERKEISSERNVQSK